MAPRGMKAAAAKAMTKGALADSLASSVELKKSVVTKLLGSLGEIGAAGEKQTGVFSIPGLAMIKTRRKPATKATKRIMLGKETILHVHKFANLGMILEHSTENRAGMVCKA